MKLTISRASSIALLPAELGPKSRVILSIGISVLSANTWKFDKVIFDIPARVFDSLFIMLLDLICSWMELRWSLYANEFHTQRLNVLNLLQFEVHQSRFRNLIDAREHQILGLVGYLQLKVDMIKRHYEELQGALALLNSGTALQQHSIVTMISICRLD